ncbi:3-deoxy-D-manno-octulosonic acid kinase [Pseudoalteromonas holothuriae]|uniref:3-deoxy-D-manno-octulosonic acid kinase n=1 Tax=Pseudoalteromonas holothuriae TaxID=2963714 RepID=A0A9W4QYV0_9GAMM|nr:MULTISPECIES: 3-deoxy-D-manno-octulosonic acid kinase [unclassified Pseudoalteromonas]CAH9059294.1 3-deoxy-D-manno-octulosonic acid kinase [Pseudoalteromonas sp. CIP111854]CAH9067780.1 3-deoxy-D-manno-octulosonic acid kinase [Pseudoalteromonas sp. CIP111951]
MKTTIIDNHYLLTPESVSYPITLNWFDAKYWQQKNAIVATKQGRATAWFFKNDGQVNVLKHYWRGGIAGKFLSDQYFFSGFKNTRVYQEFTLLCQLDALGLSISKPIAAKVTRSGIIYRGDLITHAISGAKSLCEVLQARSTSKEELILVAQTLANFHNAGVFHADLNINNILFSDDGQVYLIDFDRGQLRSPKSSWQKENISRLQRSFNKEAGKWPAFNFTKDDWQLLHQSYLNSLKTVKV